MNNNLIILKFFVEHKDERFTIKRVAETLKMNYKIVYEEIISLREEKAIQIVKQGNSNICSFNYVYGSKIVEIEEARKERLDKNIKLIHGRIKEVKSPFYSLILFGSHANDTNNKNSDIDLCLITDNEAINKQVSDILSITPLNIHLQEFNSEEFLKMLKSKESNVGNEIVKNNVILSGIEAFYELVNDVKQ